MKKIWEVKAEEMEKALLDKQTKGVERHLAQLYTSSLKRNEKELRALYNEMKNSDGTIKVNDLYRYNRYWIMQNDLNEELRNLGGKEVLIMDEELLDMYLSVQDYFNKNPKYWAMTDRGAVVQKSLQPIDVNDSIVKANAKNVVDRIWCNDGLNWSDRIWKNKEKLQQDMEKGLFDCISRGADRDQLVGEIAKCYNQSFSRARTLVRTELAHIYNTAAADRYGRAGCKYYRVLVADEWNGYPCDDCLDAGNAGPRLLDELVVPIHPNCRCTIIPMIGD